MEKTKKKALVFYVQGMAAANGKSRFVKLKGLKAQSRYRIDGKEYSGSVLMQAGIKVAQELGDLRAGYSSLKRMMMKVEIWVRKKK